MKYLFLTALKYLGKFIYKTIDELEWENYDNEYDNHSQWVKEFYFPKPKFIKTYEDLDDIPF